MVDFPITLPKLVRLSGEVKDFHTEKVTFDSHGQLKSEHRTKFSLRGVPVKFCSEARPIKIQEGDFVVVVGELIKDYPEGEYLDLHSCLNQRTGKKQTKSILELSLIVVLLAAVGVSVVVGIFRKDVNDPEESLLMTGIALIVLSFGVMAARTLKHSLKARKMLDDPESAS